MLWYICKQSTNYNIINRNSYISFPYVIDYFYPSFCILFGIYHLNGDNKFKLDDFSLFSNEYLSMKYFNVDTNKIDTKTLGT